MRHPGAAKLRARFTKDRAVCLERVAEFVADISGLADFVELILPSHVIVAMHADLEACAFRSRIISGNASAIGRDGSSVPERIVRAPYIETALVRNIFDRKPRLRNTRMIARPELSGPIAM